MFYSETILYSLFTFEKGKKKISDVSYCHCHFVLSATRGFSVYKFSVGT